MALLLTLDNSNNASTMLVTSTGNWNVLSLIYIAAVNND
jgi:hypothetical protein